MVALGGLGPVSRVGGLVLEQVRESAASGHCAATTPPPQLLDEKGKHWTLFAQAKLVHSRRNQEEATLVKACMRGLKSLYRALAPEAHYFIQRKWENSSP